MGLGYCGECDCYGGHKAHCSKLFAHKEYMNTNAHLEAELAVMRLQLAMAREALEISNIGMCGVGVPHAGERRLLQDCVDNTRKAIAAIDDAKLLEGYVLCDAEPRSYLYKHNSDFGNGTIWSNRPTHNGQDALESLPLYARRKA